MVCCVFCSQTCHWSLRLTKIPWFSHEILNPNETGTQDLSRRQVSTSPFWLDREGMEIRCFVWNASGCLVRWGKGPNGFFGCFSSESPLGKVHFFWGGGVAPKGRECVGNIAVFSIICLIWMEELNGVSLLYWPFWIEYCSPTATIVSIRERHFLSSPRFSLMFLLEGTDFSHSWSGVSYHIGMQHHFTLRK